MEPSQHGSNLQNHSHFLGRTASLFNLQSIRCPNILRVAAGCRWHSNFRTARAIPTIHLLLNPLKGKPNSPSAIETQQPLPKNENSHQPTNLTHHVHGLLWMSPFRLHESKPNSVPQKSTKTMQTKTRRPRLFLVGNAPRQPHLRAFVSPKPRKNKRILTEHLFPPRGDMEKQSECHICLRKVWWFPQSTSQVNSNTTLHLFKFPNK